MCAIEAASPHMGVLLGHRITIFSHFLSINHQNVGDLGGFLWFSPGSIEKKCECNENTLAL